MAWPGAGRCGLKDLRLDSVLGVQVVSTERILREAAAALAACDVDAIVPLYADDAVFEDVSDGESYRGRAAIRRMFEALFSGSTRFRVSAVRVAEGWGVLEWIWSGRTGSSNTPFDVRGVSILEISGSSVTKETIYYDPAAARA